ncbi:MAG: sigma-70 family RNA polymerase sigma factor [Planctomycetota bacterium]
MADMDTDDWLGRIDHLRSLARCLVHDEARADDVAQRAVVAALTAAEPSRSAGWWRRVVRNAAVDEARARRVRSDHESSVEPRGEALSAHEVVSEAESQRVVSDAVLALDEPYRTVVLLRYFKGLGPRRIAVELDRPVGTVRAQLERGRALLRQRLRDAFGVADERGGLALALLPLAVHDATWFAGAAGAVPVLSLSFFALLPLAMKLVAALPLVLLAVFALSSLAQDARVRPAQVAARPAPESGALLDVAPGIQVPGGSTARTTLAGEASPAAAIAEEPDAPQPAAEPGGRLEGRALTVDRLPAAGVLVDLVVDGEARETLWTDAEGRFALREGDDVRSSEPSYLVIGQRDLDGVREVVVAHAVRFAGRVVDEGGLPLDRVMLIDHGIREAAGLESGEGPVWRSSVSLVANLGPGGAFDLERTPVFLGRTICFSHPVFGAFEHPLPGADEADAVVVFRGAPSGYELEVRVLDPSGAPADETVVAVGERVATVDARGEVRFRIDPIDAPEEAIVARVGYEPVRIPLPTHERVRVDPAARSVVATPAVRRRVVRGVVVDDLGAPMSDALVGVWDATPLGGTLTAETLRFDGDGLSLAAVRTDREGRFELRSVARGPVRIRAAGVFPLLAGEAIARDDEVRIVLAPAASTRAFEGTLVGLDGTPIEGARVEAVARVTAHDPGAQVEMHRTEDSPPASTDASGRFRLDRIAIEPLELRIWLDGTRIVRVLAPGETVVRLDAPCEIDVDLVPEGAGGDLRVLDGAGGTLRFVRLRGSVSFSRLEQHRVLAGGGAVRLRVPQSARSIQLVDADGSVLRSAEILPSRLERARAEL